MLPPYIIFIYTFCDKIIDILVQHGDYSYEYSIVYLKIAETP